MHNTEQLEASISSSESEADEDGNDSMHGQSSDSAGDDQTGRNDQMPLMCINFIFMLSVCLCETVNLFIRRSVVCVRLMIVASSEFCVRFVKA